MKIDTLVDAFAAKLATADILIARIDGAPWIDSLEITLPRRLPHSFALLVHRWSYQPFEWGPVTFFGNAGTDDRDDLARAITIDPVIRGITQASGFIQFARPATGSYDPVCFGPLRRKKSREDPVVRLDHEAILIREQIRVLEAMAPTFIALMENLLDSDETPLGLDLSI